MIKSNQGQLGIFNLFIQKSDLPIIKQQKTKQIIYIEILIECTSAKVCTYVYSHTCICEYL